MSARDKMDRARHDADLQWDEGINTDRPPLILDLDGSLVRGNLLIETMLAFIRQHPLQIFKLPMWLLKGRAVLKQKLAQRAEVDVEALPLNEELLAYAADESASGRKVYIATAADAAIADQVARRVPFVSGVISSDGRTNLKGAIKATELKRRFPNGFTYAGDSRVDLPVWQAAGRAIVVEASSSVTAAVRKLVEIERVFPRQSYLKALLRSLRPHQWAKNTLVFVPLLLSGMASNPSALLATVAAFMAINLVASATYIINDTVDLADDRRHWSKRKRPLASGELPLLLGAAAVPLGLAAGFALAAAAGPAVVLATAAYLVCTLAYSLQLKRVPILDGFTLASLFTLRLGIGIVASGAPPSPWLLVFSMFLFASLSLAKRHTESGTAHRARRNRGARPRLQGGRSAPDPGDRHRNGIMRGTDPRALHHQRCLPAKFLRQHDLAMGISHGRVLVHLPHLADVPARPDERRSGRFRHARPDQPRSRLGPGAVFCRRVVRDVAHVIRVHLSNDKARFLVAGGSAALLTWLFRFPLGLVLPYAGAVFAAQAVGMAYGFMIYRNWVFTERASRPVANEIFDFLLVNLVGATVGRSP